jgi:putative ubiquitin-RnfH superfamily antitoxin RatB of RatAB toxin-antitoxin module
MAHQLDIEIVYALPEQQTLLSVQVPEGSTVADGVTLSGILERHPDIDFARSKLGLFGKLSKADALLRDHDRIEIYRPLIADPKEVRRQRAQQDKNVKRTEGTR